MAARHPRILLTGFEAFGPHKSNPTASIAERLDGECAHCGARSARFDRQD